MALLDDDLAPDLPPLPEGFRLVEPQAARGSVVAPARPKPPLPPLPEGFRLVDPRKAAPPAAAVAEEGGFVDSAVNIAKGAGERVMDIAGGGMRTLGAAADALRGAARAGAVLGAEHAGVDPDQVDHIEEEMSGPSAGGVAARKTARGLEETSFGYEPGTTWEDFKASPASNFVPFALETGLVSAPDMAAAMAALPAYVLARSGELGQQRAQNNNTDDATVGDILAVMPSAALSAMLDRFGGRGMFGLDEAAVQTLKQAGKEVGKAGVKEAATEAAQEGIEYAGTHVGTDKGVDLAEAGEQMAAGAVGGGGFGAAVRTGTAGADYIGAKARGGTQAADGSIATPPLPEGFRPIEDAVERAEGSGGAPAGPVTEERASPPATPSPAAISGDMREILRRAGNTDDMIDAMSAEEAEAEAGQYRAVTPSAAVQGTPTPARPVDNVGIVPSTPQERKEVLSELPIAPPLSTRGGAPGLSTRRGLATDASRGRPAEIEKAPDLDIAGQRVNTEPTDAQKEAGNYKKAHIRVAGFDITIENPKGSTRRGRDPQGGEWESVLPAHYGYIKRTIGADGDHVDVYVGDNPTSKKIYIVDQKANSPQGRFDEHKVILGANSIAEARELYVRAFNDGSGNQRVGAITAVTPKALRDFLASPQSARSAYRMGKERLTEAGFPATADGKTKRPPSLTEFIAAAGGIRDHGGELAAMDAGKIFLPGVGKLVRQNGYTLDQARALAVENGYLQDAAAGEQSTSTVDDLLVALRDDIGSYRHFSTYDDDWAGAWRDEQASIEGARREEDARGRAEAELDEIGLTRDADPQFYDRALEMVMEGMDAADAIERAAIQVNASENFVADDTPATPYFFDEEPTDAVQRGATPESGPAVSAKGAGGARPEEARSPVEGSEPPQDRGEGGAQEEPDYDGALDAALDSEFPPLPEGFRLVEPGAEGKPQSVIPGAERISQAEEAQRAADKPLRAKAPQKDVGGLFGDDSKQTDLMDLPGAKPQATVKSAAKSAAMGLDEITKGLSTLFGGKVSSGLTFDEETYRKALPFFRAGVAHFADAGRDVAEMAKRLVRHLAQNGMDRDAIERMRPYLVRFMKDWREGVEPAAEKVTAGYLKPESAAKTAEVTTPEPMPAKASEPEKAEPVTASNPVEKSDTVLDKLRDRLIGGEPFATINQARKFLQDNGWKANDEAIANKEAEELIEHAVVLAARDIVKAGKARGPGVVFDRLVGLYERQPRLATRTSQSMAEQAYSTPAPLAYVASRLAGVDGQTSVLEPSAGNGMLLIEATPAKTTANELNAARAGALREQGFRATTQDATEPGLRHAGYPVDVVIANPPFGAVRSGGESTVYEINGHRTTAIDQAIALNALQHMKPDGRAVLIVGSVKPDLSPEARSDAYNTSQKRKFYKRLYDNYNVTQHFTVDGKLYQKQGAAWPVDVIVIEGKGKSAYPYPAARVPAIVGSWEELKGYIDGSSRPESAEGRPVGVPVEGGGEVSRPAPAVGRPDAGDHGSRRPADGGRPAVQPARPESQPETGSVPDDRGQRDPDGNLDGDPRPEPLAGSGDASGAYNRVAPRERASRLTETNDKGQVPYRPYSHEGTKLNTLVPRALGDAMDASLAKVEQQHGDIDHFVAQSLGYDVAELKDVFSAEQIDAVALAIDNVAKGDAFIIGDQTGIGKGRVVAAAIRFAHRRGMVPIFVTEKPDLYGDMYRDLADIRWAKSLGRDPNIYMTNANTTVPLDDEAVEWVIERDEAKAEGRKLPPRRGQFTKAQSPADAEKRMREILAGTFKPDVVFTTYDQMNTVKGEETARRRFMDQIAGRAFLIMDESHNAGGQGAKANERAKKGAPMPRSKKFREWLGKAKAAMYSSATYAKNPSVMDLYSRTDMAKAVDDIEELPDLITKGRVPLQQVVASMMADAGQYARRERSFEGVEYSLDVADVDKANYAAFASSIRAIFKFDRAVSEFRKKWIDDWLKENAASMAMDSAVGDIAANSTEFSSIMHNLVNQMLLAIKAEAAAQRALKSLEDGEKPVVALSFTNESFLSDYAADHGTEIGDELGLTFRDMLQRYLDRALRITLKTDDDEKMHVFIPVEDLPGFERQMFDEAQQMVDTADVGGLPISPIDHIRHRLKEAGYRVAEITGRSTMIDYGHETPKYAERPRNEQGATGKRATIKKYNDGQLDAVILNRSGSTGVSMHSSSKYKDQRRRRMILAQAEGNIDTHMQMLGRVHRTGQVIPPAYTQLAADIPAEARPTAVLMKKMASLSANTTASRKSNFTADAVDFMNEYGDLAAVQWAKDNHDLNYEMGEPVRFDDKGKLTTENPMQRLTGRIMLLDPDQQQEMLDALTQTYNMILAQKEALGENVLEATALDLEAEKIGTTVMKPALGPSPFQASADLDTYRVKAPGRAMKPRDVVDAVMDSLGGDRPTSWEFARALPALQRRGQTKAEDLIRRTSDEFQSYRKWVIDGVKDAEKKQKASQDAQAMWDHWTGVVRRAPVGAQVILVSGDNETPAIVTGVVKSKRKANSPVQLSTWSVRLAIPDDSRELQLPFTQILLAPDKEADGIEIRAAGWSDRLDNLEKRFEQASTVGHEERVIATGNILAAFDQLQGKGRIIQFTDKEGVTRPGILMPRGYSAEVYAAERQVRFKDAAQAMRFLKESDGKRLTDERENIEISNTYEGFNFDINASRLKGGRYFTDDTVRKIYDKWTKYGQNMQATVDEATARRLIEAMQKLGARFVATSEQEFAQQIVYGDVQAQIMAQGAEHAPVIALTGGELGVDFKGREDMPALRRAAARWYDENLRGTTARMADGSVVSFTRKGMGKSTSNAKGDVLLRSVPAIKTIIEKGRVLHREPGNRAGVTERIVIGAPVDFAGKTISLAVSVHRTADGRYHYDLTFDRSMSGATGPGVDSGGPSDGPLPSLEVPPRAPDDLNIFEWNAESNTPPPTGWESADGGYEATKLTDVQMLEVASIVQRVAGIETHFRDAIVIPGTNAALRQWGQAGRPAEVAGFYSATYDDAGQFVRDIIAISMRTPSGPRTAYHEAFHRLQGLFLNEQERRLLLSQKEMLKSIVASRRGEDTASVMSQKELEAEAFAIWSDAMDNGGADGIRLHIGIRRAWAKLMQAIQRVRNYLRGQGFQTLDDVFETARSGRMKDRAMGTAPADGATYYQPAWHGTPHRFDRFSTEKIGTGEGAQAYGWGLYFAGKREVAEHYRDTLSQRQSAVEVDGELITVTKRIGETDARERAAIFAEQALDAGVSLDNKAREIDMRAREADHGDLTAFQKEGGWDDAKTLREAANILRDWSGKTVKKGGKLYKVEVPNDDELMLWDAPLSEQPEGVRKRLASLPTNVGSLIRSGEMDSKTGREVYNYLAVDLGQNPPAGSLMAKVDPGKRIRSDQAASEALRAAGIPGHKYADGQSRVQGLRILSPKDSVSGKWVVGQAPNGPNQYFDNEADARAAYQKIRDEQTYNYVIYDDSRVEITDQFQLMPTAEELARVPASTPPSALPGALVTQRINRALRAGTSLAKKTFKDDRRTVGDDEGARDYVTRKMVDYLLPVLRMQQKVSTKLSELNDAYLNARVAEDAALAQIQAMHDTYVKPMVETLASAGVGLEDFHKYLYALHVEERNEVVGLRHKPDSELFKAIDNHDLKGASGWSTNEAKAVLAEAKGDPERWRALRQAGAYIRAMIDVELRNAKRTGLISDETYDILTTQWKNYVPMKGQDGMDDDGFWRPGAGGFDVRGQEHKTAMGRFSEAENVIAHAITQNETSILRQHKNTVGKAMLRFINQFDPAGEDIAEVYWAGKDGFGDIEKADDVWKRRIGRDGKVEWYRVPNPFASRDDVLATKVGGKTYWIKFHDPKVGLALRKLSKTEISGISKIMRPITVWQSIVNTRANPAFTPINIIRDVLTGSVHLLDENFNVGQVAGIVKNIPKAWGGLWRQIRGTAGDAEWDRLAREYMDAGGRITFHGYADLEKTLKNLQREVTQAIEGKSPMRRAWDALTGFIGTINDVGENGIRLAAYAAARKQGRTAKESAFMARDLTVDFKKHGDWGQEFNSWFVFFNAALQGNVNIVTRMTRSKYVRRAVASFVFVGLMEHFWNSLMAGDDDDGESYYRKMLMNEPWKLERQFVFFIPGSGGKYVSFPMPYGYNAFHHMGVQAGAVMSGDKGALPATLDALRVYADAFNPIGSGSLVSMVSPTVADPVIDILSNQNFAGNPIYPSENPFDRSPDPQSYRSFSTTHPAFKTTAEWLNWLSGGNEVEPGAADIHPDTLEHLWGWATGGLGRFLTDTTSVVGNAIEGEFAPKSTPWVKNFYGEIDGDSHRTEYFRERERVLATEGYLKAYGERGDSAGMQRFQERNAVELEALAAFKAAEKQRRAINKERRRIEGAQMPEAQRAKALESLDKREAEAMRMARTAFSRAEGQ